MDVTGVVLAANQGPRDGEAEALQRAADGTPLLEVACASLRQAGCREVIVVLGAQDDAAARLVPRGALPVVATDWATGHAAALRVGLAAAATSSADAALVTRVSLPHQTAAAAHQVLEAGADDPRGTLARAHYDGRPGHPVLLGRDHWGAIGDAASDGSGLGDYLHDHLTMEVDCTGLGEGADAP